MEISDVRVKLMDNATDRLKAVCSVTFDGEFVVRDLKVVDGTNGLFVAMPSRKLAVHCPQCRHKNHLRARFCNDCGAKLPPNRVSADANGRVRLHRDIAHPINPAFRELVQTRIIERYTAERELAGQPGYQPTDMDSELDELADSTDPHDAPVVVSELTEYDALIAGLRSGKVGPLRVGKKGSFADTLAMMKKGIGRGILGFARRANTVIGVVATDAKLTKAQATKVAQMAQDGVARTIQPAHTMLDGDVVFTLSTGAKQADVSTVGAFAAEVMAQAIVRAVRMADSAGGLPGLNKA